MKIGIIGAGHIARALGFVCMNFDEAQGYAVASRDYKRAEAFAEEFGFEKAYGSYEELYNDPEVELVYVATPNNYHYEHSKTALEHGKHVLCEKPFTMNALQAQELLDLAREKCLFITEAQMLRFVPYRKILEQIIRDGLIGDVLELSAYFCENLMYKERVRNPEMGGGTMMDLGVYPLTIADMVLGYEEDRIVSRATLTDTGVDETVDILLTNKDGRVSHVHSSVASCRYIDCVIIGNKGHLVLRNINCIDKIELYDDRGVFVKEYEKPVQKSNYEHEVLAVIKAINDGKLYPDEYPWDALMKQMRTLDKLRNDWSL